MLRLVLLLGVGHVRVHADLLLDGLRVVEHLLAVAVMRTCRVATRVHQLFPVEKLGVKEGVLPASRVRRCLLVVVALLLVLSSHATLIVIDDLGLSLGYVAPSSSSRWVVVVAEWLGHVARLGATLHRERVHDDVHVASQASAVARRSMRARLLN